MVLLTATSTTLPRPAHLRLTFYALRLCNQLGQALFFAGLLWYVGGQQNGAFGASSLMVAMMVGAITFGLAGGALSDSIGPPRAVVAGAAGRGLVILATLGLALQPGGVATVAAGTVLAFLYSAVSQVYCPAEMAMVRAVTPHRPGEGHAALVVLQYAGQGLAVAVAAGLALVYRSPVALLSAGVVTYLGVTVLAVLLAARVGEVPRARRVRPRLAFATTLRLYRRHPRTTYAAVVLAFSDLAAKALLIAVPYYLANELGLNGTAMVALAVPAAAGVIAGLVWVSRSFHDGIAQSVMRLTLAGTVVSLLALAALGQGFAAASREMGLAGPFGDASAAGFAVTVPVALLLGFCFATGPVSARAVLTTAAPRRQQSRVFAMQSTFTDVVAIVPLLLAGAGAQLTGAQPTFVFLAVVGGAAFVALELAAGRRTPAGNPILERASTI